VARYDDLCRQADLAYAEIAAIIGRLHAPCQTYTRLRQQSHKLGLRLGATSGPEPHIAGPVMALLVQLRDSVPYLPIGPAGFQDSPLRHAIIGLSGTPAEKITPPVLPAQLVAQVRGQ
jgi:hypothetical protein